jgi:hypothetical protein
MTGFVDNSKYLTMIKNRPSLGAIPKINKRILTQSLAHNIFFGVALLSISTIFLLRFRNNAKSEPLTKVRKDFNFETDPFSGKVSCTYKTVPNRQHGY